VRINIIFITFCHNISCENNIKVKNSNFQTLDDYNSKTIHFRELYSLTLLINVK